MSGPVDARPGLERLRLYASAVAGHTVDVAAAAPAELAWTDGTTIFVDASADPTERIRMLSVQASLVATGSLNASIVRQLVRHPALTQRYLAIEAHRALAANETLLPPMARVLVDRALAARVATADESLALARSRRTMAGSSTFGTIHPRRILAALERVDSPRAATSELPSSQWPSQTGPDEFLDDVDEDPFDQLWSSPVGGGGPVGRLLRRMFRSSRSRGGGPPGGDAPSHRSRSGIPNASSQPITVSATPISALDGREVSARRAATYPEWDVRRSRYRPDWCTVLEIDAPLGRSSTTMDDTLALTRPLARLGLGLTPCRRQPQGDGIDIDAAIESLVDRLAGAPHEDDFYVASLRRRRDLAMLVLLDVSGSAGELGAAGMPVHEHQRSVAASLTVALHELGDRVALYAFNSRGRTAVQFLRVKQFDDRLDGRVAARLDGLAPAAYTRLGAAIRHGTALLEANGGTSRPLLVVLSDGFAYDHGYEGRYGEADARRALVEARRRGVGCLCLSVGAGTEPSALRRVFGAAAHASVPRPHQLVGVIGPLFRAALASAEAQRRAFQRTERTRGRLEIERRTDDGSAVLRAGR